MLLLKGVASLQAHVQFYGPLVEHTVLTCKSLTNEMVPLIHDKQNC